MCVGVVNGGGFRKGGGGRAKASETDILGERQSGGGAAEAATVNGEVTAFILPIVADGLRCYIRPEDCRQPGYSELPASRAWQVRSTCFNSSPDERRQPRRRLLRRYRFYSSVREMESPLRYG